MTLESLALGDSAKIANIDWDQLAPDEGQRLRALGLDVGAEVTISHRGIFGGADPLAIKIGRMTIALRRKHAAAMTVVQV